jgi:phage shock protein A
MALINRVSRLFRADMHAVLDRIEEPDLLLKQAIREMEAAHAEDEQRNKLLKHELNQLESRQQVCQKKLDAMEVELDICFHSEEEALARKLIRRKLETEQLSEQLEARQHSLHQKVTDLAQRLQENRIQLESMRQKSHLLDENQQDFSSKDYQEISTPTIQDADIEIAFLREKQKRSRS